MATQLNLLQTGEIIPTALHAEMERSYLEYAMSVIVGRALPDVRDGLKPVHRRILYAMHELGLTPDRPYRKCARVVGDVLGKYHPHGDQAVYDAMVRMVQDFSSRYPLLAGHGNFGSVDNDPPAAMRYTETRLAPVAHEAMLSEIGKATVDFIDNFDNSQQEPLVVPAQLPILLLNGCSGIAVGMATNVPPHNLSEVVDGLIALIDKPDLPDEKLWQLIPGPDFPTGGEIVNTEGIKQAYSTGRGIIPVRGVAKIEQLKYKAGSRRHSRTAIVVTELPFQVNKAGWIEKMADLVGQGRLEGISDIRDESDRDGMRVVVELKRDASAKKVLRQLYKKTPLQSNFGAIMLALVNNEPRQLPLRELLQEFLNFREETLTRRYRHELEQAQNRLHLVEGLLAALNHLDAVIELLKNAPDGTTAKGQLQQQLNISDTQADSILAMPLRRITGLERQKLESEAQELQGQISGLDQLLGDRHELLKALKKELRSLKRKYGDERRTRILNPKTASETAKSRTEPSKASKTSQKELVSDPPPEAEIKPIAPTHEPPTEDALVVVTNQGYVEWETPKDSNNDSIRSEHDFVITRQPIDSHEQLIVVTNGSKAYPLSVADIPPSHSEGKATLVDLLPGGVTKRGEEAIAHFFLPKNPQQDLLLLTEQGRIKRTPITEVQSLTNRGSSLVKLKEGDQLRYCQLTQEEEEVAIATTDGRILRLPVKDEQIPVMGRTAQGNLVTPLRYGEALAGCVALRSEDDFLVVSQLGYGKRMAVSSLSLSNCGDLGTHVMQFTDRSDRLAGMVLAQTGERVMLYTNQQRRLLIPVNALRLWNKDGTGDRLAKLKPDERIITVAVLA
ncbi:MAG: DNA gyrase/topoisomerase IV subunit A [Cyanobacteriota bacterium]